MKNRITGKIWIITAVGIVMVLAAGIWGCTYLFSPGASSGYTLRIPANATEKAVRDSLEKRFGEKYTGRVMRISSMLGFRADERHGAYFIDKGTSPLSAARKISRGAQTPVRVTINGFRNRDDLLRAIAAKFEFSEEALYSALDDPKLLSPLGLDARSATALFLNDSYDFFWTDSPEEVLKKIAGNYSSFWNEERTKKASALGLTPKEAVIIASIVDEETTVTDEKGTIARLYINRLQKGMRLQADPTVRFAHGDFTIKRITADLLRIESPYNTYRNAGVPPGPIRTVGKNTLEALLDAPPSDYLYMCARPDFSGRHDFSRDFSEHKENARNYRQELDRRNITR